MIEIKAVSEIRKGKFLVNYTKTAACGCSYTRHAYIWERKTKPSFEQALVKVKQVIANDTNS